MFTRLSAFFCCFLLSALHALAQNPRIGTCVAFASNGDLLTGEVGEGKLKLRLFTSGKQPVQIFEKVGNTFPCEISFSRDGKWAALVAAGNELTIFVLDRAAGTIYRRFSSPWLSLRNMPLEPGYQGGFLGGFLENDSLVLWRYAPLPVSDASDGSQVEVHRQVWSIDGKMLQDRTLGPLGWSGWRTPIALDDGDTIWLPGSCKSACYLPIHPGERDVSAEHITIRDALAAPPVPVPATKFLLAVAGNQTTKQQAILLNESGQSVASATLPFIRNPFQAVVPDWFGVHKPELSPNGKAAAIARGRVAWVLVDTDRDWGSEIILLRTHPLGVFAAYKTGKGGIASYAVDERNGVARVVGYWNHRWNDLRCDQSGKCKEAAL